MRRMLGALTLAVAAVGCAAKPQPQPDDPVAVTVPHPAEPAPAEPQSTEPSPEPEPASPRPNYQKDDGPEPIPKIRVEPTTVGDPNTAVIRRVIRRHAAELRQCYERRLQSQPTLAGRIVVRFVIDPSGAVETSKAIEGFDVQVDHCVELTFRRMRFPAPRGGRLIVKYPLVFGEAKATPAP